MHGNANSLTNVEVIHRVFPVLIKWLIWMASLSSDCSNILLYEILLYPQYRHFHYSFATCRPIDLRIVMLFCLQILSDQLSNGLHHSHLGGGRQRLGAGAQLLLLGIELPTLSRYLRTWLPQSLKNLENLEKCQYLKKVSETWKSQGKLLKKHISRGKVRE